MASCSVQISGDTQALQALLDSLLEEFSKLALEVRNGFLCRFEAIPEPFCLDGDGGSALRTGECRVVLQPSDALLELVRAFRAGELDAG